MRLIARFVRLPGRRRRLLVAAAALELAAGPLFVLGPVRAARIVSWLSRERSRSAVDVDAIGWAVAAAAATLHRTCLAQAFAARVLTGRAGIASTLTLAVRSGHGAPAFHAWTSADGRSFPPTDPAAGFVPVVVLR